MLTVPFDEMTPKMYNLNEVNEIVRRSVENALSSLNAENLDSGIRQDLVDDRGGTMSSNHKERYYYTANDGTQASVVFYGFSRRDTDAKFQAFLADLARQRPDAPLLKDFVENTYKKMFMRKLSPTSKDVYTIYLDRYILPVLGNKHMDQITVEDVQYLYDWMAHAKEHGCRQNLTEDTIKRTSGLLGRLYHIANDMELVSGSPIKKTLLTNDGAASVHHKALPDVEVARVKNEIPHLKDDQQRLYMGLLAYTGMRREEIAGLGWEHIFLDEGYGTVMRTVVYPDGRKTVVRNKTKTIHSTRDFIIPDALADILRPLAQPHGFVIHGKDPEQPAPFSTLRRLYKSAFKALGITEYSNHDWRATFGTQLKESGLTSAQVADLMGHADTRMVETTYAPSRHEGIMKHKYAVNNLHKIG